MKTVVMALAMSVAVAGRQPAPQDRNVLVGSWVLISASATAADGSVDPRPYGPEPSGLLIYSADGRMSAIVSHSARPPLSGDRISSPAPERAQAFATSFAYAGRYSVSNKKVIHHVDVATVQNWVNTNLERLFDIQGGQLTLSTPPLSVGGNLQRTDLIWRRVK